MKKCTVCNQYVDILRTAVKEGNLVSARCDNCLDNYGRISDYARKYNRDRQKEDYRKDTIQRFEGTEINEEFVRAYPKEAEAQFGKNVLRDYGKKRKQF